MLGGLEVSYKVKMSFLNGVLALRGYLGVDGDSASMGQVIVWIQQGVRDRRSLASNC
jgi:hypothetical protein